ncbi:hypothetical protein DNU06_04670 [Putridiphycobacter roseus]|uniref:Smr domain-containing protein n=1 Tax=Putridiphycobacter roseus TaxID=2219161 RepID=A0A2W1NIY2_9FLAO|nr:Smr/MutS family protein [Putridiphycobacter roseus]PZE17916.1 hypothetical protein DNU06_04670 [Putridiphycobacter roseus]
MFSVGDQVAVIHEAIEGVVLKVQSKKVSIEDLDGFERIYNEKDIVKIAKTEYEIDELDVREVSAYEISATPNKSIPNQKKGKIQPEQSRYNDFEIDLHIEALQERKAFLSNGEILQIQMMACRMFVEKAIHFKNKKVVLIHGKGQGVLKSEIYLYLNRLEETKHIGITYESGSKFVYGDGATQVNFFY